MKNKCIFYIILFISIGIILSGFEIYSNRIERLVKTGNELYYQENYEEAREVYEKALSIKPEEKRIKHNLANISFQEGNYQEAFEFYQQGPDSPDKYLLMGSSIFFLVEGDEDPVQKIGSYQKALEVYKEGIIKYPQELWLKYNYEYIKNLLKDLQNEQENQENQSDQKEENEEKETGNQENQNSNSNDEGDEDREDKENQNEQNEEEKQNNQNQKENQEGNNQGAEEMEKEQSQEEGVQDLESSPDQDSKQSLEEIKQILEMLEKAEEDSLKNNQSIYQGAVKEEKYDW